MKKEMYSSEITVLRDTFRRLLRRHAKTNIVKLIDKTHPADLALIFRYFNDTEQDSIFSSMSASEETVEFLNELDESITTRLIENETPNRLAEILEEASSNEQAYLMGLVNDKFAASVINLLQVEEQEELEEMMAYPEDSAGILMYTDVFTLHEDTKAREAIYALQDQEEAEMVFYLYALDDDGRLTGVISLRELVTTPGDTMLKDIMSKNIQAVRPETDQEEVILLKSSWENARIRLPWLFASWIGGIVAAFIIGVFDNILENAIALAAFIPVIIGMGGNVGTQSSTIIVRGLATGRVSFENSITILFKEMRVGLILGILYGMLLGLFAIFQFIDTSPMLGVVVGLSICISMILAATIGSLVPLVLNRFEIDPAIATGPFVTTAIDIRGVAFYFLIARSLLLGI